ncbi:alpha-glucan family phosphorylase [Gluconobacter frateurii]|uniref:alpha-glucan family phosphorylase n=1 Tax=Gluconobacter frateurii TaxID=38308 RepID=UPI001F053425|nr:alpha-glucan family phosphorylase [Gluconobacter frateurii]UMM08206.1 alpha-glucan family phosphorylase [Gluconobacter frateurii]
MATASSRPLRATETALKTLALDLHWTWNHEADLLWQSINPDLWEKTRNPWITLTRTARSDLAKALADPDTKALIKAGMGRRKYELERSTWFGEKYPESSLSEVAYFSMEFMLSEALPIYSGGLGNVAADQLKAASDVGVPVVAVGLLYAQGYFRQEITPDGAQKALYPFNDPAHLPIQPVLTPEGDWFRLSVQTATGEIWLRAWKAVIGRATLYLLDTNDPSNPPAIRCITTQLYGGDAELRLRQEMVLGIAGWRLLYALGHRPEICHLNEGHAAFAALERARCLAEELGIPFSQAQVIARAGTLFTTHTAVPAGFDLFPPKLIESHLTFYSEERLGLPIQEFLALGRLDPSNRDEFFNMAYLAVRSSCAVNGVSQLHGEVSRSLFAPLFPRWPKAEVPVSFVTNGVHTPTWDCVAADELWTKAGGKGRWEGTLEGLGDAIRQLDDDALWQMRCASRCGLIQALSEELRSRQCTVGENGLWCLPSPALRPDALTIGFARRFATYKRPDLLLHDEERLVRLLKDTNRPVQIILAGKAHPKDMEGQAMITRWINFCQRQDIVGKVVFLADYDMALAQKMVQGVDLWLNTPRRPWEASGTSGMKILVNGGLNLSERDGWWAEAYTPEVGWALGDGLEHGGDPAFDHSDAQELYRLLEEHVLLEFFDRNDNGIPHAWVAKIRESMARLTPQFSANRTVREYTETFYLPLSRRYRDRCAGMGNVPIDILDQVKKLREGWKSLQIGEVVIPEAGRGKVAHAFIHAGSLDPAWLDVQFYAEPLEGSARVVSLRRTENLQEGWIAYETDACLKGEASDYTLRIIPAMGTLYVPLEAPFILWQR